jgi:DNA-binding transcriptional regulator YdaS (Cro superfamily)
MRKRQKSQKPKILIDEGLLLAVEAAGTRYRLAKLLGVTPTAVLLWDRVPVSRLLEVERVTGISRKKLRPELYRQHRNM